MSDDPSAGQPRKIIVDEDWKSQVEREREELKTKPEDTASKSEDRFPEGEAGELPPASFLLLATTLATQAMAGLGQIPDPIEQKPIVNLQLAQHYIDMLSVLEEKTKGNLTDEETEMLTSVLYQLRSVYIAVRNQS